MYERKSPKKGGSEKYFEAVLETIPEGIVLMDKNHRVVTTNSTFKEMFDYNDLKGKDIDDFIIPEKLIEEGKRCTSRVMNGEVVHFDSVRKTKEGKELFVSILGAPVVVDGEHVGIFAIYRDISERKKMEEELRESEQKYRSIVENAHSGILIIDENYTLTYVNDTLCEILGYPRDEIIDHDFREFLDEASTQLVTDRYRRRQRGENVPSRYEFNIIRKDGEKRRVEVRSSVIKDPEGKPKTVAQILDITKRKKAEQELKQKQNHLEKAQEIGKIGTWELDVKNNKLMWTDEVYRIFGIPLDTELTYEDFLECVHPDDREYVDNKWKAALQGEPSNIDHRIVVGDEVKWVREKAEREFDEQGNVVRALGAVQEITERKETEEALKKQKEELSEFAHTVSHDLKNYINIIKNRAQLSLMKEETAETNAKKIVGITEKMEKFVSRQLELADAGKAIGKPEKVDLNKLLEEVSENHDLAVKWEDLPIIEGDPQRLKEMFHNLIENAVIHGEATRVELTAEQGEDASVISVKDNGKGIPEEHLDKIFDMGYSTDGFGIGLSIVKRIVEAHGWSIGGESAEEEGTTFTLTFSRSE